MSVRRPFEPSAGGERTVIKPNPRAVQDAFGTAPTPAPAVQDLWSAGVQAPPAASPRAPQSTPRAVPQPSDARMDPAASVVSVLGAAQVPDANPIMRAARHLLLLLANLRVAPSQTHIAPLMEAVAQAIAGFERDLLAAGIPEGQVTTAKYVMCATADDIVQNLPGGDRSLWTRYSMLSRFFQTRDSGVGFFDQLARVKANPALNLDLLELMHACLSLGLEGKYRTTGGDVALQQVRRDVYETLRHVRARPDEEISPHWRGQEIAPDYARIEVPVWAVAAVAGVVLLGVYLALCFLLWNSSDVVADWFVELRPQGTVEIARVNPEPVVVKPPSMTQLQRIRAALASDIEAKRVGVEPKGRDISVRLISDVLFDTASADVKPGIDAVLGRVGDTLNREPGRITVIGHTDDRRLRSSLRFRDNQELSEERARVVADLMRPRLAKPDRVVTMGRGPDDPLVKAKTDEARARNRRVDILIPWMDYK